MSDREEYEDFFRRIATSEHLSCVLLTSRVKFSSLERIEGIYSDAVRSLKLQGLDTEAGRKVFQDIARKLDGEFSRSYRGRLAKPSFFYMKVILWHWKSSPDYVLKICMVVI